MIDDAQSHAESTLRAFLTRIDKGTAFNDDTPLYTGGIGLDSLETAELSAVLEDELGTDPFSSTERMPQTVGDILRFYRSVAADA